MRKADIHLGDQVLLRYGYTAIIKGFSVRYVIVDNGTKLINVHHSDIIKKYNGGRGHGNGYRSDNGGSQVLGTTRKQ